MNTESRKIKILTRRILRDRRNTGSSNKVRLPDIEKWPQKWQDKINASGYLAAYMPIDEEPLTDAFLESLSGFSVKICFPRVEGNCIVFYEGENAGSFESGSFSILEPKPDARKVSPEEIGVMLIPALAYAMDGTRLGRGKGFYDRFCGDFTEGERPFLVGTAAEKNLFGSMTSDPWDLKVDAIVTETSFIDVSAQNKR